MENLTKKIVSTLKECLSIFTPSRYPKTFKSGHDLVNWLNQNGIEYQDVLIFDNGDWKYEDQQGFYHLIRNGVELTKGLKVKQVYSYDNGTWIFRDEQGFRHIYSDGIELTKGVNSREVFYINDGTWRYKDIEGNWHYFDKDNNPI